MELEIKSNFKSKAGFTLVEILIALVIFSLVIISMTAIAISVIKSQRKAFSLQDVQETSRYILETMSKEIRMSTINSAAGSGLIILNITNAEGDTFDYQFDNTSQAVLRWGEILSPVNIEVTGSFDVRKSTFPERAVVTIVMKTKSQGTQAEEQVEIYLQSSLSSRGY